MRRWLVLVSASLHLALVFGLFVAGFWKLEQLDRPRVSVALSQPLPPPPAPAGGAAPTNAPKFTPKTPPKKVSHELTQLETKPVETAKPIESPTTGGGEGSGEGSGRGSGDPLSKSDCTDDCGPGEGSGSATKKHDDGGGKKQITVDPKVIRGMRIAGETQVHPPEMEQTAMLRDGKDKVIAVFQTCVNEAGGVGMVKMLKSTGYGGYDQALTQALSSWQYKPYKIGDRAVTVCGIVTFIYQIR